MNENEIQKLKDILWANTWSNEEIIEDGICSLKQSLKYKEEGFRRIESSGLLAIYTLQQENQQLKEQLLEETRNNYKLKGELEKERKEYQETYKDVREEMKEYKNQLKQGDKVIDETIEFLVKILDRKAFVYSDLRKLVEILQKYKGDNNERTND